MTVVSQGYSTKHPLGVLPERMVVITPAITLTNDDIILVGENEG